MKMKLIKLLAFVPVACVLASAAGGVSAADATANTRTGINLDPAADGVKFPKRESAWLGEGAYVNVENLTKVAPGTTKEQMYILLDKPHFSEGFFGPSVWNYIFHLRSGAKSEYVTCQYQVQYDRSEVVQRTYWDRNECIGLLQPKVETKYVERVVERPAPAQRTIQMKADALFAFDKSSLNDLLPGGAAELERVTAEVRSGSVERLQVVAYADRLGKAEYNLALSQARARTIADYFVRKGVPADRVSAVGRGATMPVVQCDDKQVAALRKCLAPNRRVEVQVWQTQR
ncbi:outer membrane protein OmpA-like peptidoglycan-associated protein [Variovorax boronicumulans]|uniref:OmpA family protein n=1 Tax=Variovorax boronicumulans TaxID=436515 RepID=UPI002784582A|nr:OmpA family protein [Variovorax boronicumulans]MDQ0086122.1 outer membrane protein OmpA-like peptidoglycan-associated protein [Variovorax boronicumulans]